jgi:hypothetical protein
MEKSCTNNKGNAIANSERVRICVCACMFVAIFTCGFGGTVAQAADVVDSEIEKRSNEQDVKKFDDVLADLMNEFSYDLKTNQVAALKIVSIRRVAVNESVPKSYESYIESMVSERLRLYSKIKNIQCTSCRVKKTVIENGRLTIVTPINSPVELDNIANQLGVETWLDVALLYQENSMVLAFNAFDSKTKELIWTKVYNSESIYKKRSDPNADTRSEADKINGVAQKEKDAADTVWAIVPGYHLVPNVKKPVNMAGLMIRAAERFADGRSEIGAMVVPLIDPATFISNYTNVEGDPLASGEATQDVSQQTIKPFTYGLGLMATYHHNFFKVPESKDKLRPAAMMGAGFIVAQGYMAFTIRFGGLVKFGKHFVVDFGGIYSNPTTISIREKVKYTTKGGIGGDVGFGLQF